MLRALRQLCSGPPWENVPSAVVAALTPILTQVWGAGAPGVCMTLQEAVLLTLQLPRAATSAGLRNTAINTTLGFLKSPSSRLQLAAVTLLANNWPLLKDSVTPALLHAVVHNLHTTTSSIITNTTLHLLYTMANHRNYKSVVGTLVQYCSAASPSVLQAMLNKISKIVSTHADDALWCLQQLQPLLLLHPHPALCSAMSCLVSRDIRDGRGELVAPALQLLGSVLEKNPAPRPHAIMAASVLAPLNSARAPTAGGQDAGALLTDEYGLVVPDVVCAPFMSDDERTLLDIVNEKFINNVVLSEKYCDGDQIFFECLQKIGLFSEGFEERTVGIALSFINSPDVVWRSQAREALAWIRNKKLACRVLEAERQVRKNLEDFDWTLPYLEEYIVESLEKKNEMPYLPRSCSVHGDGVSLKPLVIKPVTETMHGSLSVSPRSSQSCQSTPRLGSQSSFIVAQRPGHTQSLCTDRRSYAESYRSLDQASNSSCTSSRSASFGSSGLLRACRAPSTSTDLVTPATDASSSVDSVSNSVNSSLDGLHRPQASTLQPEFDILQPGRSKVGTLPDGAQPTTSAPKLLWSVEGRSPHLGASFVLPPEGDTIEVAAEAMEELRLEEEEVPSTAAALARALYAGLGSK
ncbi:uncharacterized protein LOC108673378 [Hyalella azteca]|uniref:Uncharacterized protein LOC108673378 n=1 Tax=Hyalella azteca TaxID=294128 RepID=A0A8B7NUN4_HYAAZ|nr:uncharacterized protein LOC108673378 [Hyalella azteca]